MAETSRTRLLMIGEAAAQTFTELVNVDGFSEEMRKAEKREGGLKPEIRNQSSTLRLRPEGKSENAKSE